MGGSNEVSFTKPQVMAKQARLEGTLEESDKTREDRQAKNIVAIESTPASNTKSDIQDTSLTKPEVKTKVEGYYALQDKYDLNKQQENCQPKELPATKDPRVASNQKRVQSDKSNTKPEVMTKQSQLEGALNESYNKEESKRAKKVLITAKPNSPYNSKKGIMQPKKLKNYQAYFNSGLNEAEFMPKQVILQGDNALKGSHESNKKKESKQANNEMLSAKEPKVALNNKRCLAVENPSKPEVPAKQARLEDQTSRNNLNELQ